jgi:hypothetical protein
VRNHEIDKANAPYFVETTINKRPNVSLFKFELFRDVSSPFSKSGGIAITAAFRATNVILNLNDAIFFQHAKSAKESLRALRDVILFDGIIRPASYYSVVINYAFTPDFLRTGASFVTREARTRRT